MGELAAYGGREIRLEYLELAVIVGLPELQCFAAEYTERERNFFAIDYDWRRK